MDVDWAGLDSLLPPLPLPFDDSAVDWELLWFLDMYGLVSYAQGTTCTCRKSRCLKLYCACYSSGVACHAGCACVDCVNTTPPCRRRVLPSFCTCKRGCSRMYCECRKAGRECGSSCKCVGCVNCGSCGSSGSCRRLKRKHAQLI